MSFTGPDKVNVYPGKESQVVTKTSKNTQSCGGMESHGDTPQLTNVASFPAAATKHVGSEHCQRISTVSKHDYDSVLCLSYLARCRLHRHRGILKTRTRGGESEGALTLIHP